MALSSFVQTNFAGGEISQSAQGRLDLPSYKISMNVCFNGIPVETGGWMRRPGTRHVAPTRGGTRGKLVPFSFAQSFPYVMEFTDGFLRFTNGPALVMTNDQQAVNGISAATPAEITTVLAHNWSTGNTVMFNGLGSICTPLQNRQFVITKTSNIKFTIADAITGAPVNGTALNAQFASGNVTRVMEIATTYIAGSWSTLRSVQAEARTVLLNGTKPQVLQVATQPTAQQSATFTYGPADFIDGPYLDPVAGSVVTPNALNGLVTLTLSFSAFDATRVYNVGDFVTAGGVNYKSILPLNGPGNTPVSSPAYWVAVNGGAAINNGAGFQNSDIGRLVRLYSEPAIWVAASTYATGNVVAYADGSGGFSYWTATAAIGAGIQPGTSTLWALNATGAQWTWGQTTSVSGAGLISPVSPIGGLTGGGGLAAAFDGNTSKAFSSSANFSFSFSTYPAWSALNWTPGSLCQFGGVAYEAVRFVVTQSFAATWNGSQAYATNAIVQYNNIVYRAASASTGLLPASFPAVWILQSVISQDAPPNAPPDSWLSLGALPSPLVDVYIGQHYTIASAIQSATLWPTTDVGIDNGNSQLTIILRAKATAPVSAADGTVLGSVIISNNTTSPVSIVSNDNVTTWNYVWFDIATTFQQPVPDNGSHIFTANIGVSQAQFFAPNVSNGSVIQVQIRGPALLYNLSIRTWRAGVYSDTTGWPTCGTYHEGRIWLGGVVSNRFDSSVSNGLNGAQLDFTPTSPSGTVSGNNAISYVCTGEASNQILWMTPDQQGIIFGTQAGEWLISAPSAGPLAPTNIKAVRVTKIGCANIEPRRAEHTLLFVQRFDRKVMEYFADVFSGKFSAPNLSERAKHLTVTGIAEIAYQQELAPVAWFRRNDGGLVGATYKRDTLTTSQGPTIIGWHRHLLGSGRAVESICTGPSVNGNLDTLSMITNDPTTGVRHIEVMTDLLDEGFSLTDCWFLDDAIAPTSTAVQLSPTGGPYGSLVLNGLSVHEGKTVTAFIAGLDCGDFTVASGSITVPFGDGVSGGSGSGLLTASLVQSFTTLPAVVGFTYNSDGQLVRPVTQADTGAQSGPGFAKLGRQHRAAAQMYGMVNGSISFGTDFTTLYAAKLRYPDDTPYTVQQQWSGIWRDNVNSLLDFDGMICWRISRPLPALIVAAGGFDSKADA